MSTLGDADDKRRVYLPRSEHLEEHSLDNAALNISVYVRRDFFIVLFNIRTPFIEADVHINAGHQRHACEY